MRLQARALFCIASGGKPFCFFQISILVLPFRRCELLHFYHCIEISIYLSIHMCVLPLATCNTIVPEL